MLLEYCVCNAIINKKHVSKLPNAITFLHRDFNLSEKQLQQAFLLPHKVAFEPYVRAFQYKELNKILYTDEKLVSFHTKIVFFVKANQEL